MSETLSTWLKYLLERLIQNALKLFWVIPIRRQQILFSAFSGRQYSDSPKRISDELLQSHPEYQQIWAFVEPRKYAYLKGKNIRVVKFKSLAYLYYATTSHVFVDNVEFWSILTFRQRQMVLQTWHGGGCYKQVGSDRMDIGHMEHRHVIDKMRKNTLFISSCKEFTKRVIRGAFDYKGAVLEIGLPRNDELIHKTGVDLQLLRKHLNIPADHKIVLYAPTFRNSLRTDLYNIDISRLRRALHLRFDGEWTVLLRLHYYMPNRQMSATGHIIDVTSYPDMQHLLQLTDVLITDYSSSLWDFSLMYKPAFVYASDLADYCTERNFYTPIGQWPFPVATDNDSLEKAIYEFCEEKYRISVRNHHKQLGSTETGEATHIVCQYIEKHIMEG